MRYLILAMTGLLLAGCNCLPEGEAPEGPIVVTSYDKDTYSTIGAVNYMTTSLTTFGVSCLKPGDGVMLKVKSGEKYRKYAEKALQSSRATLGFKIVNTNGNYVVTAEFKENTPDTIAWHMTLAREAAPQNILWQNNVIIDTFKTN